MKLSEQEKKELFKAVEHNDLKKVKYFVFEQCASLFMVNEDKETLAHVAAKHGHTDIFKYLARKEPSILGNPDKYGNHIFYLANAKGAIGIIKYLVEEHGKTISGNNPLRFVTAAMHTASEYGHLDIVKYFVDERKCDVNLLNKRRETPVFTAAEWNRHDIVKYLVEEKHADLTLLDKNRANILYNTVSGDDLPLIKYFLDERKVPLDVNWQDKFGQTILHRAAIQNRTEIVEYLVGEKHADVNIPGYEKMTPLHWAAARNLYAICKYLIDHGANVHAKNDEGKTPIQKTLDKRLLEYMRNATSTMRSRRSVNAPHSIYDSISIPYECTQRRTIDNLLSPLDRLEGNSAKATFVDIYSSRIQNFLVVAEWIFRRKKRQHLDKGVNFLSLPTILEKNIDPIAVNAIKPAAYFAQF